MPDNMTNISTQSPSNDISPYIAYSNSNRNTHDILDRILLIKNNTIDREKNSHITSSSWSVNNFLSKIKDQVSRKLSFQPAVDIELDDILSQGRKLSQDPEALRRLLNDKKDIVPSSTLSLTTKTGIALGGMLLTGSLVGGGFYYSQRTARGQYHEFRNASDSNLSPASPYPPSTYHPFYSPSPDYIPPTSSDRQDTQNRDQINNELINSKLLPLITEEESQSKKTKRHNVPSPCNYTEANKKREPIFLFYTYSSRQLEVCLTESFNQRCQGAHQKAREKHGCFHFPNNLLLKITGKFCMCPPPNWLEVIILPPQPEFLQKTDPPMILMKSQPADKPTTTTTTAFTPMTPTNINTTQLYNSQANSTVPPKKSSDKPELFTYENEGENLTLSKNLRRISKIIANPGAVLLTAGKSALDPQYVDNTQFYQSVKKVETVIDNILMWIPMVNRAFISINIIGDILNLYSDSLEGKEMDQGTLSDLIFQATILSKDIISSVSTADIKKLSSDENIGKNQKFLHPFSFEENNLMMMMDGIKNKIKVEKKFNHLYSPETEGFIFYDYNERWITENYNNLNINIKNSFEAANKAWNDPDNIYLLKNSSPTIYENGVIIRYKGELFLLIEDVLHRVEEIPVTDDIYRYVIKNNDKYTPVIYQKKSWVFEESSSPLASQKLRMFLDNNHIVKNNLVSKNINHQDVSPLVQYFHFQFDKESNKYLKINDQYYIIKTSPYGNYYIEGSHDLLELQYTDHQYHIKDSPLDDICCFHKKPINTLKGTLSDPHFFLDKKVIDDIKRIDSLSENKIKIDINEMFRTMRDSKNIDKAITVNGIDYILCDDKFIQIHSNGDDTYILGDPKNDDKNILVYKNQFGDTYFKIPRTRKKWYKLVEKPTHCIIKRQPEGACAIDYYESHDVSDLLEQNSSQSIIINDYEQQLELHDNFNAIYQEKENNNNLYYNVKDNIFFHVRKNLSGMSSFTPSIFVIYGRSVDQQINLHNIITKVCVIKDFDTQKTIFSTPEEAQTTIFSIPQRLSKLFLKIQEQDNLYKDITSADLAEIKEKQSLLNDMTDLKELFFRSGKKILSSIEYAESALKEEIDEFLKPESKDGIEINNLKNIEQSKENPVIEEVCNNAFKKTVNNIDKATTAMKDSEERFNQYITEKLGISDTRAVDYFASGFKNKLERIKMYFNEDNKENIMIIMKKKQSDENKKIFSEEGELSLGFTINNDPLDRIFINTVIMKDFSEQLNHPEGQSQSNSPLFPQPDSPIRNRMYFTNLISETMIHESVHALGSPDDYLYLPTNKEGYIDNIKKSIKQIEKAIAEETMEEVAFKYFSKLYFMSNPVYNDFSFASLNKPEILTELFRQDSFYRAILLLKNPDTISLLIRELANPSQLEE